MSKVLTLAGTRPEIIKLSQFIKKMKSSEHALLYTGQHFSENMRDIFFDQLGIRADFDLRCNTSDTRVLRRSILRFLRTHRPEYVVIYGDTYSSMAGALASKDFGCKLIHLEAGIRDLDSSVPEEIVRIKIDSISDYLYAPTRLAKTFLSYENIRRNVFVKGNLISDVCRQFAPAAGRYSKNPIGGRYVLLTMHRPENVDDPEKLMMLVNHLKQVKDYIVFPVHPRTRKNLSNHKISLPSNVTPIEPAGYLEFLSLLKNCEVVLTDSGGVTEEAIILKKPCITLRHTTARWETILLKANVLFPLDSKGSLPDVIEQMRGARITQNPYGENVAAKIANAIQAQIS